MRKAAVVAVVLLVVLSLGTWASTEYRIVAQTAPTTTTTVAPTTTTSASTTTTVAPTTTTTTRPRPTTTTTPSRPALTPFTPQEVDYLNAWLSQTEGAEEWGGWLASDGLYDSRGVREGGWDNLETLKNTLILLLEGYARCYDGYVDRTFDIAQSATLTFAILEGDPEIPEAQKKDYVLAYAYLCPRRLGGAE